VSRTQFPFPRSTFQNDHPLVGRLRAAFPAAERDAYFFPLYRTVPSRRTLALWVLPLSVLQSGSQWKKPDQVGIST
jgi:hypothetical protein